MYIAFLDDDDEWLPERIELGVILAESCSATVQVFYCGTIIIDEAEGERIYNTPNIRGNLLEPLMAGWWTPPPSTMFFRSTALQTIQGFDEHLMSAVDHDIWMKCAVAGFAVDYVPSYLVKILSRPIQGRMTFDPQNRIMGVKRFLAKWKPEIEQAIGKRGYKNFCGRYLAREYFKFGISVIQNGDRLGAIRNNIHAVHNYPTHWKAWTIMFVVLIGGCSLFRMLRSLRHIFLPRERYLEMQGLPGSPKVIVESRS